MSVTQADIARHAGVSQRTVSNVVNGLTSVSPDKMERVNAAILELGYSPSLAARSLRVGRSGVLQLVVKVGKSFQRGAGAPPSRTLPLLRTPTVCPSMMTCCRGTPAAASDLQPS